jgi:hypothetical protein
MCTTFWLYTKRKNCSSFMVLPETRSWCWSMLDHVNEGPDLEKQQAGAGQSYWLPYNPRTTILSLKGNKPPSDLIHFNLTVCHKILVCHKQISNVPRYWFPFSWGGWVESEAARFPRLDLNFSVSFLLTFSM